MPVNADVSLLMDWPKDRSVSVDNTLDAKDSFDRCLVFFVFIHELFEDASPLNDVECRAACYP
jgi:hypothetical protein